MPKSGCTAGRISDLICTIVMPQAIRHPVYYFSNGTHIFRVENTLYKLHNDLLMTHSALFEDMFAIGDTTAPANCGSTSEGKCDTEPILLEGETQAGFDLFLDHIHGRAHNVGDDETYTHEQLRGLLEFADKYRCPKMRKFTIDYIWDTRSSYHPSELVQLGCRFRVSDIFLCGFRSLLDIPLREIRKEHRHLMGKYVFVQMLYAKSVLDEHTWFVACEEPEMYAHPDDCRDPVGCREDWHAIWRNGLGRFLLDARNPQPFDDAVDRFQEMQFGRMSQGCQNIMFQVFNLRVADADEFIDQNCSLLVHQLRLNFGNGR